MSLPGYRPKSAFFALFLPFAPFSGQPEFTAPEKARKRRKMAFFLRYPLICLPHLQHPNKSQWTVCGAVVCSADRPLARLLWATEAVCGSGWLPLYCGIDNDDDAEEPLLHAAKRHRPAFLFLLPKVSHAGVGVHQMDSEAGIRRSWHPNM